jgi:hypothetical protein
MHHHGIHLMAQILEPIIHRIQGLPAQALPEPVDDPTAHAVIPAIEVTKSNDQCLLCLRQVCPFALS